MLEICFTESAGGCLKYAVSKGILPKAPVACLMLALSFGDIANPEDIEGKRAFYDTLFEDSKVKYGNILKKYMQEFQKECGRADAVRIWYSNAPSEYCGMLYISNFLANKGIPVFRVNCGGMLLEKEAGLIKGLGHSGEMEPKEVGFLAKSAERMTEEQLKRCAGEWQKIVKENAPLRIVRDGHVVSVSEDYYDETLLKYVPREQEVSVAYVIGTMIGREQVFVEDYFLAKRIRAMIEDGRLRLVRPEKHFYRCTVALA